MKAVFADTYFFIAGINEGINETLTGDRHFAQAGFVVLLKPN